MEHPEWTLEDKFDAICAVRLFPDAKEVERRYDSDGNVTTLLYLYGSRFDTISNDCFPSITRSNCYKLSEILGEWQQT